MIKKIVSLFILFFILTCPLITGVYSLDAKALVFTTIEGSSNSIPCIEILREAYGRMGIQIRITFYPGERSLMVANKGVTDGEIQRISGLSRTYTNLIQIPESIGRMEGCVYSNDHDFTVNGWESLAPYQVGVMKGGKFAETPTLDMNRVVSYDQEDLFKLLNENRIELAVLGCRTGNSILKKRKYSAIKRLSPSIAGHPIYHYLHKRHLSHVPKLTKVISDMKNEGRIASIWNSSLETP
jgi:polar amino acid transport system substrate-binding protein